MKDWMILMTGNFFFLTSFFSWNILLSRVWLFGLYFFNPIKNNFEKVLIILNLYVTDTKSSTPVVKNNNMKKYYKVIKDQCSQWKPDEFFTSIMLYVKQFSVNPIFPSTRFLHVLQLSRMCRKTVVL